MSQFVLSNKFRGLTTLQAKILDVAQAMNPRFRDGQTVRLATLRCVVQEFVKVDNDEFYRAVDHLTSLGIAGGIESADGKQHLQLGRVASREPEEQKTLVELVIQRCGNRCAYCSRNLQLKTRTVDHVVPESRGGGNRRENLVPCCTLCNQVKGDRTPEEWASDILNWNRRPSRLRIAAARWQRLLAGFVMLAIAGKIQAGRQ